MSVFVSVFESGCFFCSGPFLPGSGAFLPGSGPFLPGFCGAFFFFFFYDFVCNGPAFSPRRFISMISWALATLMVTRLAGIFLSVE